MTRGKERVNEGEKKERVNDTRKEKKRRESMNSEKAVIQGIGLQERCKKGSVTK